MKTQSAEPENVEWNEGGEGEWAFENVSQSPNSHGGEKSAGRGGGD